MILGILVRDHRGLLIVIFDVISIMICFYGP